MFRSWVEFFAWLANVAQNRVHLTKEVEELKAKGKTHFDDLHKTNEAKRIAESKLFDAEMAIEVDHHGFKEEKDRSAKEKTDLIIARDYAITTKADVEAKVKAAELRVIELRVAGG
ncbi:uncharacterized protein LOC130590611 [Beta vulgaris subsp. vulgaris]|uniref:uncharacterized protein LOC130590611 n=1 Tax=Beta vulgaris subsp. vulgaris TaxID=3555 RepID=UPI0025466808|nr:uncharacterized protein LOC130590611 [Beta vulgaris subsp. vulgaris]